MSARVLVLTGFGINCEEEMAAAWRLAGAEATVCHLNDLFVGRAALEEYDALALPGGFSFGDDLGSGKVLANLVRLRRLDSGRTLLDELERFLGDGKLVLGICNGFQVLVKLGLLPNAGGRWEQEATLARNDSGRFEDRWCEHVVSPRSRSPFLAGLERIRLPVRHGEGRLVVRDERVREAIVERGLDCLAYADHDGRPTGRYPENPNGSELACAALSDPSGQVLGMMPHPEAFLSLYNDPTWPQLRRAGARSEEGQGLRIFHNAVRHVLACRAGSAHQASQGGRP